MNPYILSPIAEADLANIYRFTRRRWGATQADVYIETLFAQFDRIARSRARSRPVTYENVDAQFCVCERHFIYWRWLSSGQVGVITILHQRMVQADRVRKAYTVPF